MGFRVMYWGSVSGSESIYEQQWGEYSFRIENYVDCAAAYVNEKKVFEAGPDLKVITDLSGKILSVLPFTEGADCRKIAVYL